MTQKQKHRGWGQFFTAKKCTTAALSQLFMRAELDHQGKK
jgi:hypothetical protein